MTEAAFADELSYNAFRMLIQFAEVKFYHSDIRMKYEKCWRHRKGFLGTMSWDGKKYKVMWNEDGKQKIRLFIAENQ